MKHFKTLLLSGLLLAALPSTEAAAQAFNTFNGRNHPEIKWMEAESEHFRFIYASELEKFIPEAAAVAESTYTVLSTSRKVEFNRKIKVYFSNEDEIVNGAAVPFNGSYTFIWLGLNNQSAAFSSDNKWVRKVLAHELTHLFHFEAVKSNIGLAGTFGLGNPGERDFMEGFAQYSTETWDALRGDWSLRTAIFDDKPNFDDGTSLRAGRLIYSEGFSKLLFLSEQYDDSTLTEMLAYRDTLAFGIRVPNVYKGFRKATGEEWSDFEDRWLKHINVYYNTLASQSYRTDSLKTSGKEIMLHGNSIVSGASVSPDGENLVVSATKSVRQPYTQLLFYEADSAGFKLKNRKLTGATNGDMSWSDDAEQVYYSKSVRGKNGSIGNDLFELNLKTNREKRLSKSERLMSPVFLSPEELLAIQNQNGTGNVVSFNLKDGPIKNITRYAGDIQLMDLSLSRDKELLTYSLFDANGSRYLVLLNLKTGEEKCFTNPADDDRQPKLGAGGQTLAYASLRDEVPNVFLTDTETGEETRITNIFTGAELLDWNPETGFFLLSSTESKSRDRLFLVPDSLRFHRSIPSAPEAYSSWTKAGPDYIIAGSIPPAPDLIQSRKKYSAFQDIGHLLSFGLPYYEQKAGRKDYGVQGFSTWTDPLGKYALAVIGNFSFTDLKKSYGLATYLNNTSAFSLGFSAYRMPEALQFWDDKLTVSLTTGLGISADRPLDWFETPYSGTFLSISSRAFLWEPYEYGFTNFGRALPGERWQNDLVLSLTHKFALPDVSNDIHPQRAYGINLSARGGLNADDAWFGDNQKKYIIGDLRIYDVRPVFGRITLYSYGRAQRQAGRPLPFESVQLSRFDNISLPIINELPLTTWGMHNRVRGYRSFIAGNQLFFNTEELRFPLLPSLHTSVLGLIHFGRTTLSLFSDAAHISGITIPPDGHSSLFQWGLGSELKNKVSVFGLPVSHALGLAKPYDTVFKKSVKPDLYYKIQAVVAF